MCLAVPGKIVGIIDEDPVARRGSVEFGGILKEVNLSFVPEAVPGDYVLVHVGFALTKVDEAEAQRVFEYLERFDEMDKDGANEP
jgi:hydrogenase expression/formation protein HypC